MTAGNKPQNQTGGGSPLGLAPRLSPQADAAILRLARLLGRQMAREAFEARQLQQGSEPSDQEPPPLAR